MEVLAIGVQLCVVSWRLFNLLLLHDSSLLLPLLALVQRRRVGSLVGTGPLLIREMNSGPFVFVVAAVDALPLIFKRHLLVLLFNL